MKTLLLIDGHSLLHRAFHALPSLTTPESKPIGAVYGFSKMLLSVFLDYEFDCVIVAWDRGEPTFRHEWFAEYKQHRPETDESLRDQIPIAQDVVEAMGITQYSFAGYEADDIIGTAAHQLSDDDSDQWQVKILSSDHDLLQLVTDKVHVLATVKGISTLKEYDISAVEEKYELAPKQIIDLKGLMGDSSDNIPGVKGVGIKTATELLKDYHSVDGVYEHIEEITGRKQNLLAEQQEMAYLSKKLAKIRTDAPITIDWEECSNGHTIKFDQLLTMFQSFGFSSLLKQFNQLQDKYAPQQEELIPGMTELTTDKTEEQDVSDDIEKVTTDIKGRDRAYLYLDSGEITQLYISTGENVYALVLSEVKKSDEMRSVLSSTSVVGFDLKSLLKEIDFIPEYDLMLADAILAYGAGVSELKDALFKRIGVVLEDNSVDGSAVKIVNALPELHAYYIDQFKNEPTLENLFKKIEMPLLKILDEMEKCGILVDLEELKTIGDRLSLEVARVEKEIFDDIGHEINLNSPKQLEGVLFDELRLPVIKRTKTQRSTAEGVLKQLKHAHPAVAKILEYRTLTKLISTYTNKIAELVTDEKRINTTFNQLKVVTARLSSEQPNMQNVPNEKEYGIRRIFVAPDGCKLVALDYSQIELRILAHLSQDEKLIQSFKKDQDIHAVTAANIFDCFVDEVDSSQRNIGKTINFAVMYGMGPHALSESLEIEYVQAKKYIDDYFEHYPAVQEWREKSMQFAKEHGYVETIWGRKLTIQEIRSKNRRLQSAGERMATNYPNQGTQADLIKKAMVEVNEYLTANNLHDVCRMNLQVHDELIFEIKKDQALSIAEELRKIMEGVIELDVPAKVDVKIGDNWQEMEEIDQK